MTVFLAVLAALVLGIIGGIAGFLIVVALGYTIGPASTDGGIEMGAAFVGAPIGLVAGAILGALLVIRLRRGRDKKAGPQGWIALGIVGAVLVGLYMWLFYEPPAPLIKGTAPRLISEIRVPVSEIDPDDFKGRRPQMWTYNNMVITPNDAILPEIVGDEVIWKATHDIPFDYEERIFYLWIRYDRVLMFDLGIPGDPPAQPEFTEWRAPTHVRNDTHGEDIPGPHAARIRFRIER